MSDNQRGIIDDEERGLLDKVEDAELSGRALFLALFGVGLVMFISNLDNSIVSIAIPSISADLNATPSQASWVGTSYLLSQTIMTPVNGRLTDIVGRRPVVWGSILVFGLFSGMSGAASDIRWLIAGRALTGIGGGSFVGMTPILISDMVPWHKRGAAQSYMALSGLMAGAAGPLVGGWLTQTFSWRWCFYVNVPICAMAFLILVRTLRLKPPPEDVSHLTQSFDYVGLALISTGAASLVFGFSNAADLGFVNLYSRIPVTAGGLLIAAAVLHLITTKKNAIVPTLLITRRTPLFFLISTLCQSLMFIPATFLLPQFFQGVKGATSEESGLQLLPFSLFTAVFGFLAGQLTSRLTDVRRLVWTGYLIQAIAYSLVAVYFTPSIDLYRQELIVGIVAAGIGLAISPTMLVIQASVDHDDMAAATSGWVLVRSMGPSIGLALFTGLLNNQVRSSFEVIPGYGEKFGLPKGKDDYAALHRLPEPLKTQVLEAFAGAFKTCWMTGGALMSFALLLSLCTTASQLNYGPREQAKLGRATAAAGYGAVETDDEE